MLKSLKKIGAIFSILAILTSPMVASAALALDASTASDNGGTESAGTSVTLPFTIGTVNNSTVLACLRWGANEEVTTMNMNGVAMTKVARAFWGNQNVDMFYMNATSTSNVFTSTWATNSFYRLQAISYTGAKQSGQPDSFNTGTKTTIAGADTLAVSTTVVAENSWLVGCASDDDSAQLAPGTGMTARNSQVDVHTSQVAGDSNGTVSTGSQSMTVNKPTGNAVSMAYVLASIAPFTVSAPSNFGTLILFGDW